MRSVLPRFTAIAALAVLAAGAVHAQSEAAAAVRPSSRVAAFDGLWCGTGLIHMYSLRLSQQEEQVQGKIARPNMERDIEGHVEGTVLHTQNTKIGSLVLERTGDRLRVTGGNGPAAIFTGLSFQRAAAGACSG